MTHTLAFSPGYALVTGGATGIGRAIAEKFLAAGVPVVITGRTVVALQLAADEMGEGTSWVEMDVRDRSSLDAAVARIEAEHGAISYLVNNAGANLKKPFEEVTDAEDDRIIETNLTGCLALTRSVVRHMSARGSGSIVMVSSMAALVGLTGVTAYSASKAAMLGIVRSLAVELGNRGIRVNAICPGFIDTAMFRKAMAGDKERFSRINGRIALGSVGQVEDVSEACLFLCSDNARYITGVTLPVDGGFSIGF